MSSHDYRNKVLIVNGPYGAPLPYQRATGLTAHVGGGQASGTALTAELNFFSTVANAGDSATLSADITVMRQVVVNDGAHDMDVFPASGGAIDAGSTDAALSVVAGTMREFFRKSNTLWRSR